ncbi:arginine--tRNA ligase [archaeon]|jgi:arginyl-tRNA synthetase|nr:arginine--tRNA ligase [archaeon]MBT3450639.1 arginine--tRNA ligase [archaeon]MBT6868781.1 arginine--tRNA ligase [archaeon]MBT7192998.1 arginine--tRNA ligase [archaeon]MBT7380964.1 arginine--tRNA ligase [archaeon]
MNFRTEIIQLLSKIPSLSEFDKEELDKLLSVPPNSQMGDYAFPCFKLGKNPKEEADKLKGLLEKKTKLPNFLQKITVAGPYLNFYISQKVIAEQTLTNIFEQKKEFGKQNIGKNKKVVIDFSHPNIAKPFGIGHLRSTVIGNSLYKTFQILGYQPVSVNHLGDWGTQFGKLITAYKRWGDEKELNKEPIKYLLKLYVKFHELAEKDESLIEDARKEFKELELKNKTNLVLWESFKKLSLKEFKRIYDILDVDFDSYNGESFYVDQIEKTMTYLEKKVPITLSDGALIVDLEAYKMPPVLLKKSNGSTTYHTRDFAAALYRLNHYKPCKLIYVVGSEQKLHFKQLFKVLHLAGKDENKFVHVDFGLFKFPEGKMSTRKGNVIFLEDVLNKSIKLAEDIIQKKNPNLKNKTKIAKMVGVGAVIFSDLSNERTRNINFDWDRMLSFEGETAPYLQYTHARSCSILRKAKKEHKINLTEKLVKDINFNLYESDEELNLIKHLEKYPEILVRVSESYKPHHLAMYLITLAQKFNEFYHKHPVISDREKQMKARLLLVNSVRQVLENGLGLLGIKAPDEM